MASKGGFKFTMLVPMMVGLFMKNMVNSEDENNIMMVRIFFACGKTLELILFLVLYFRIGANTSEKTVDVSEKDMQPPNPLASMMGIDVEEEEQEKERLTYSEYDSRVLFAQFKQTLMQTIVITLIHYKWGYLIPMVVTVFMAIINKLDNPLVRIYIKGESGYADLKRPFKNKSPFSDLMGKPTKSKKKKEKSKKGRQKTDPKKKK
ncbi:hypothetical protein AAMO2058_001698200 [Amorphochlora amoebiformis]